MAKVAIISPREIPETFIQAHLKHLDGDIYHLYNANYIPLSASKHGAFAQAHSLLTRIKRKMASVFFNIQYEPNNIEGLKKYLKEKKIDIALAEYGMVGAEITPILKELGIPLMVHFHGHDATRLTILNAYKEKYLAMFHYASSIVVVSNDMKNQLLSLGASLEKITINPCGPQNDFAKIDVNYLSNQFFFVGRFVDKKAPHLTLFAFKIVHEQFPESKLIMAGDGYLLNSCKNLAKVWNLENSVDFVGNINHDEVKQLMSNSFCYIQHSIIADDGDSEGTPVAILEAQLASLPVIATKHAGIKESVLHEKTGFLVVEKDVTAMSEYMIKLYSDRNLAKEMGTNARKFIQDNYTIEKHISVLNNLIHKFASK